MAQSDVVQGISHCPEVYEAKPCGLKGSDFQQRKARTIALCKETELSVKQFSLAAVASVVENRTEELTKIREEFNEGVRMLRGTSLKCNNNGKNGYKQAEQVFYYLQNKTEQAALSQQSRLSSEDNPVPLSSEVFVGNGELFGYETELNDYTGGGGNGTGQEQIRNSILRAVQMGRDIMIPIAIFMIALGGFLLFFGRGQSAEESRKKRQNQLIYTALGFGIILISVSVVDYVFFGHEGEILRNNGENASVEFAQRGFEELEGVYDFLSTLVVISAVIFLVIRSIQLIMSNGQEEMQTQIKKQIGYTITGIVFIVSLKPILNVFTRGGKIAEPSSTDLIELVAKWADYLLGFVGVLAVVTLIYAGIRLVIDFGNGEAQEKAKKLAQWAAMGIVLAFSAWTIINFFANPSGTGILTSF